MPDAETVRTLISGGSLLISFVSLAVAVHTRKRSQREAFDDRKELAAKEVADNNYRAASLVLRADLIISRLQRYSARCPDYLTEEATEAIENVTGVRDGIEARQNELEVTPEMIRSIEYDKDHERKIRAVLASANSIAGNLQQDGWKQIFEEAENVAARLQDRSDELYREGSRRP